MKPPTPRRPSRTGFSKSEGISRASAEPTRSDATGPTDLQTPAVTRPTSPTSARGATSVRSGASPVRRSPDAAGRRRDLTRPVGQSDAASILGPSDSTLTANISERRSERVRAKTRLYLTRALYVLAAAAFVGIGVWGVFFSEVFALNASRVEVSGVDEEVITISEVMSSVEPYVGVPLPRVDTAAIETAVESNVVVASSTVSRVWPTGLKVEVALRQPAMAEQIDGAFTLVDSESVAFKTVSDKPEGIPLVALPVESGRTKAAADVMSVWAALDPSVKEMISVVAADGKTVSFTLTDGRAVSWGTPEKNDLKAKVLLTLLSQYDAKHYDVSSPVHPVTS